MCGESSAFCMQEVVIFCLTWPIWIGNCQPASVYAWIQCLWCINNHISTAGLQYQIGCHPYCKVKQQSFNGTVQGFIQLKMAIDGCTVHLYIDLYRSVLLYAEHGLGLSWREFLFTRDKNIKNHILVLHSAHVILSNDDAHSCVTYAHAAHLCEVNPH
jgi:hypothetical protein